MKNKLKRTGARTWPYFIPLEISKGFEVLPLERMRPMKEPKDLNEFPWTAEICEDDSECFSVGYIKSLV